MAAVRIAQARNPRASFLARNTSFAPSTRQYQATLTSRSLTLSSTCEIPVIFGGTVAIVSALLTAKSVGARLRA